MACPRVHFRRLVYPWTDTHLGNCSYLDTCRNMRNCKYVHYELDPELDMGGGMHGGGMHMHRPGQQMAKKAVNVPK